MFTFGPASRGGQAPDPLWAQVILLIGADDAEGSTSAADASPTNSPMTRVAGSNGGTGTVTSAQSRFGTRSIYGGPTNVAGSVGWWRAFIGPSDATSNWCFEGWFRRAVATPAGGDPFGFCLFNANFIFNSADPPNYQNIRIIESGFNRGTMNNVFRLLKKDLLLELRQPYAVYGVLLYAVSTVFVLFLTMDRPEPARAP